MPKKSAEERQGEIRRALVKLDEASGSRVLSGVAALSVDAGLDAKTLSNATGLSEQTVTDIISKTIIDYNGVTQDVARQVVARFFSQSVIVTEVLMRDAVADYVRAAAVEEDLSQKLQSAHAQGMATDNIALQLDEARGLKSLMGQRMMYLQKEFSNIMKNMGIAAIFVKPNEPKDKGIASPLLQTPEPDKVDVQNDALLDAVTKERNDLLERARNFNKATTKYADTDQQKTTDNL